MLACILREQLVIDSLLAEFVLDHGNFLSVCRGQDMVEQRCLPTAEEARKDRHRNLVRLSLPLEHDGGFGTAGGVAGIRRFDPAERPQG